MNLRPATIDDAEYLFRWRNDDATRRASIDSRPIEWRSHLSWLEGSLSNELRKILIAESDNRPTGTVRYDVEHLTTELSWTIAPEARKKGFGSAMVRLAVDERTLYVARIKSDNVASQKIAARAGFELAQSGELQEWIKPPSAR